MGRLTKGKWIVLSAAAAATLSLTGLISGPAAVRAADPPNAEGVKFFEAKIRPILAQHCTGCHGADKQKGGLRLDTRENLLKGGKDEDKVIKVVEPGDPAKSMIIEAVNYKNEDMQMPPPKKKENRKLSDEQIKDLTDWVKQGVPYGATPVESPKKEEK